MTGFFHRKFVSVLFSAFFVLLLCGQAEITWAADHILIVHADSGSAPMSDLMASGLFDSVDEFDAEGATPVLGDLTSYDAVLAYTNSTPADQSALGNVLADYVDGGGHLVICTYSFSTPWEITGRIMTAGYAPLTNLGTNGEVSGNLSAVVPADPIFSGIDLGSVSYFHNNNFAHPGLDAGATLLATDGAGINMIARNSSGNIYGVNLFPETGENNQEIFDLIANMLDEGQSRPTAAIPTMTEWGMMLFALMLGSAVIFHMRKRNTVA